MSCSPFDLKGDAHFFYLTYCAHDAREHSTIGASSFGLGGPIYTHLLLISDSPFCDDATVPPIAMFALRRVVMLGCNHGDKAGMLERCVLVGRRDAGRDSDDCAIAEIKHNFRCCNLVA